ncbi:MAG: hypothetical protein WD356_06120 [Pseudomonadales bacterium]
MRIIKSVSNTVSNTSKLVADRSLQELWLYKAADTVSTTSPHDEAAPALPLPADDQSNKKATPGSAPGFAVGTIGKGIDLLASRLRPPELYKTARDEL